jgi:recombinational DNA repair ATPase RecF
MKITSFQIQNYRNIRLAEVNAPPDFMVICGGNGCGKSAVLNALMTAKEHAGAYGSFEFDPRAVSADSATATISLALAFSDVERQFVQRQFQTECPEADVIEIEIKKGGQGREPFNNFSVGTPAHTSIHRVSSITSMLIDRCQRSNSPPGTQAS